ncbi:hypothetical protein GGI17_006755 [Coemansia sp. S146]|nr:hypothetical protein GGI17_006755 [Coemansia sp. S146]
MDKPDAIHVSAVRYTTGPAGCYLLAAAVAEPSRFGSDPSMQWQEDIKRWEIHCPDPGGVAQVVYTQRDPVFAARSYFGRFTRCFLVLLNPDNEEFNYIVKDSWQLAFAGLGE